MLLPDITATQYYADDTAIFGAVPTLTQSIAKLLLNESPLHAWRAHPRLGGLPSAPPSEEMVRGTVIGALLLNQPLDDIAVIEFPDYRSKAAQRLKAAALAGGQTPLLTARFAQYHSIAERVRPELVARFGIDRGHREITMAWEETTSSGAKVPCRARIDHCDEYVIHDLKTVSNANPRFIERTYLNTGYDVQAAAYLSGYEKCRPDLAGRVRFVNPFIEIEDPHHVIEVKPSSSMLALGAAKWRRAVEIWHRCLTRNYWPGYDSSMFVAAPNWALAAEMAASPDANLDEHLGDTR
jgi:hypothetical protein